MDTPIKLLPQSDRFLLRDFAQYRAKILLNGIVTVSCTHFKVMIIVFVPEQSRCSSGTGLRLDAQNPLHFRKKWKWKAIFWCRNGQGNGYFLVGKHFSGRYTEIGRMRTPSPCSFGGVRHSSAFPVKTLLTESSPAHTTLHYDRFVIICLFQASHCHSQLYLLTPNNSQFLSSGRN